MKRLEGIKHTPELRSVLQRVMLVEESSSPVDTVDNHETTTKATSQRLRALEPLPASQAEAALEDAERIPIDGVFPMSAVKAMRTKICSSSESPQSQATLLAEVEDAVSRTSLVFSAPPTEDGEIDKERKKHLKRMERLRLKAEENSYKKLTQNLDQTVADDVTMKSMSYAASIGLNMIVAPISFGVFMYFFAGQLFGWVTGEEVGSGQTDIKSVITGVISGVLMLFIEMTLFVIRSHEMDASVRKKAKKTHVNPFGYDKQRAKKTFNG